MNLAKMGNPVAVHFGTDGSDLLRATIDLDHPLIGLKFKSSITEMGGMNLSYGSPALQDPSA